MDKLKPTRAAVMKRLRLSGVSDEKSAQFVRAYEAAVAETIESHLRTNTSAAAAGRIK